jgi:hypothetical protein
MFGSILSDITPSLNNSSEKRARSRSVVIRGVALAVLGLAACSMFEIPAGGFLDERPDSSAGSAGASGTSGGRGGNDGSGGTQGTAGNQGSGGAAGSGGGAATGGNSGSSGSSDGGSSEPWWPYTNEHSCQSAGVPSPADRPAADDPGASLPPLYLVISRIRLGTVNDDEALTPNANAWRDIGFDLDKRCTTSSTCENTLQEPIHEVACKHPSTQIPYDGNQCRDNELSKLFKLASSSPSIGIWFGMTEADWNCELHRGGFGNLIKISDYNGKKNDRQVRLDVYSTLGLQQLPTWTCRNRIQDPLATNWSSRVSWRADEHWKIASSSISLSATDAGSELPDARVYDPAAFVRNGYLFAKLPDGSEFGFNGTNTRIPGFGVFLYRGIMVGELIKEIDGTWSIDHGTVGGVVRPDQLLQSFEAMGFCANLCTSYDQVKDYLNTYRDALTSTADILPDTPCDGLSFGEEFEARQASAGKQDIESAPAGMNCPQPRHPDAPRQGCICPVGGGRCELDGGT